MSRFVPLSRCLSMPCLLVLAATISTTFHAKPSEASTFFALVNTGQVFASTDEGDSWSVLSVLPSHDPVALAAAGSPDELYIATRSGTFFRSADGGANWIPVGIVGTPDVTAMVVLTSGDILVLAESGTLFRSTDEGMNFTPVAVLGSSDLTAIARDSSDLYAVTGAGIVEHSSDSGSTWIPVGIIQAPDTRALRAFGGALHALSESGNVWRSMDGGASWTAISVLSQVHGRALTDDGTVLLAGLAESYVATSLDGMTWTWRGSTNQVEITGLGVDTPQAIGVSQTPPPRRVRLGVPWPNPAPRRGGATFPFLLSSGGETVEIGLYDVLGRLVARRAPQTFAGDGSKVIAWDPRVAVAGEYLVILRTASGGLAETKWVVVR